MLSKSQAKTFFLVGTAVCVAIFVGLSVDSFSRIPKQTNVAGMNDSVIRGKHLFEKNNCMGCHTILGEGAYYAPELTKVFERRGQNFIKAMLRDPEAMYPGQRKMTNYHFKDQEIDDLTEFLTWIGTIDLNGFPPKPDLAIAPAPTNPSEQKPMIFSQMCIACHALGGQGGAVGPALDGVGSRRDADYLKQWLTDPFVLKADSKMPKLPLSEKDITELTAYLSQLK